MTKHEGMTKTELSWTLRNRWLKSSFDLRHLDFVITTRDLVLSRSLPAETARDGYQPCLRLKRATSRAVSRSIARFFRSARLSRAALPSPTPSSALSFPFFQ